MLNKGRRYSKTKYQQIHRVLKEKKQEQNTCKEFKIEKCRQKEKERIVY